MPDEGIGCGFTEAVRGVLSHHMVIRDGKIANYHPYPPTPWNANPRDVYGTPGPVRGRGAGHADLRGERPRELQGHRHHAHGAQLRPVPAVRRAHVPRRGQDAEEAALARPRPPTSVRASEQPPSALDARQPPASASSSCSRRAPRPAPVARERAEELVRLVVELYGAGLERVLELRRRRRRADRRRCSTGSPPTTWSPACCSCTGCTRRPRRAGASGRSTTVRPYLGSHGGDVELLDVDRRRRRAPAAARQLRRLPVVGGHAAAGGRGRDRGGRARDRRASRSSERPRRPAAGVIPVESLTARLRAPSRPARVGWARGGSARRAGGRRAAPDDRRRPRHRGLPAAVRVSTPTATRCAALRRDLRRWRACSALPSTPGSAVLTCRACGAHFDVRAAGADLEEPERHLDPVPLLERDGAIEVAVRAPVAA